MPPDARTTGTGVAPPTVRTPVRAAELRRAAPAAAVGAASVVVGGLVAAVTATAPSEHGAWLAAYLVLVGGVAQIALAVGQALLATGSPSPRTLAVEITAWNLGNVAVVVGTLTGHPTLVGLGGALLVLALALLGTGVRRAGHRGDRLRWWALLAFRLLLLTLLVSIPVGLWLAVVHGP
jgi:hypothetical protein